MRLRELLSPTNLSGLVESPGLHIRNGSVRANDLVVRAGKAPGGR
jgi:hypothetical protein